MKIRWFASAGMVVVSFMLLLGACGGSDSGSIPFLPLSPPAYNITGTWTVDEVVTNWGSCTQGSLTGIYQYDDDVIHNGSSNTFSVADTRSGVYISGTISGSTVTINGERYMEPELDPYCDTLTGNYTLTLSGPNTFAGSGRVTCWDAGYPCSVTTAVAGSK